MADCAAAGRSEVVAHKCLEGFALLAAGITRLNSNKTHANPLAPRTTPLLINLPPKIPSSSAEVFIVSPSQGDGRDAGETPARIRLINSVF